jgi:hypothetical protein
MPLEYLISAAVTLFVVVERFHETENLMTRRTIRLNPSYES